MAWSIDCIQTPSSIFSVVSHFQIYGVIYIVFSIFWFYMAPEEDKYLYENILDWEMNRVQASIWAGVGIGVVVPVAAFIHYAFHRCGKNVADDLSQDSASNQSDPACVEVAVKDTLSRKSSR